MDSQHKTILAVSLGMKRIHTEEPVVIEIDAVFDDTDIIIDYFAPDRPIERWFVCMLEGKVVTEGKLRSAVKLLPQWLQMYGWTYRPGEKYSMSDHPYGQLRAKEVGVTWPEHLNSGNVRSKMDILMNTCRLSTFEMNDSIENPIPATYADFKTFIGEQIAEREAKLHRPITA